MQNSVPTKEKIAETLWLLYFNEQARRAGLVDEATSNRLRLAIMAEQKTR